MPHFVFLIWQFAGVMTGLGELAYLALAALSLTALSKASHSAR